MKIKVGIIGGSGLYSLDCLENAQDVDVSTPYGKPSDKISVGTINGVNCAVLARHGRDHKFMPSTVNYRANIWALRELGCTHIIASTACGSLREDIKPGELVLLDQFIDRTTKREQTFYDCAPTSPRGVCHAPMDEPFCSKTRQILYETAQELGIKVHAKGTCVTIEGPRFSSKAESHLFRRWEADVVNMTTVPEVVLAKEAGLCYAAVALPTDYDCWRESEENVTADLVLKIFAENVSKVTRIFIAALPKIAQQDWTQYITDLKAKILSSVVIHKSVVLEK
ncbi:S-methyl-5'-thioadenosine phosphorylase-like isoform X2 [Artemia franciscana]|uniref:S-methyl-5'-thioadenosine phosphorylase n=1 Tax=Artemia franciscana TaxID=6661 RepID=A0AA88L3M6_ARTSF|nr:hypothetical protein QYM36_012785 [Artemia franciscana]